MRCGKGQCNQELSSEDEGAFRKRNLSDPLRVSFRNFHDTNVGEIHGSRFR